MTISDVERHATQGHWTAVVADDEGKRQAVDRRYGSWRYTPPDEQRRYWECEAFVAAELQKVVRPLEKAERAAA